MTTWQQNRHGESSDSPLNWVYLEMFEAGPQSLVHSVKNKHSRDLMKTNNCGTFLKERRKLLGLEQQEVASKIGIKWEAYRQWECRRQIPEKYLPNVAVALRMSMLDILIAKWKPHIAATFDIELDTVELFIRKHSKM